MAIPKETDATTPSTGSGEATESVPRPIRSGRLRQRLRGPRHQRTQAPGSLEHQAETSYTVVFTSEVSVKPGQLMTALMFCTQKY